MQRQAQERVSEARSSRPCGRTMKAGSSSSGRLARSAIASWRAMPSYDALILGGGPAGATAGLILARAGWRVAIAEKSVFPRRKVCGEFISATSLPLLFELGVGDEFLRLAGTEVRRVGLFEG